MHVICKECAHSTSSHNSMQCSLDCSLDSSFSDFVGLLCSDAMLHSFARLIGLYSVVFSISLLLRNVV